MFGKKKKRPRLPEGDDGRTIASMNVEGMPWYAPSAVPSVPEQERPVIGEDGEELPDDFVPRPPEQELLSGKALRRVILSATLTALGVGLVFILGCLLLILFMLYVWQ